MTHVEGEVERASCPQCGESAPLAARLCPHCRTGLLVDLVVAEGMSDARARYQAAKAIGAAGPPFVPFAEAHHVLELAGGVLAQGLTRLQVREGLALLAPWGVPTATPSAQAGMGTSVPLSEDGTGGSGWRWTAVVILACCVVGVGIYALKRPGAKEAPVGEANPAVRQEIVTAAPPSAHKPAAAQKPAAPPLPLSTKAGSAVQNAPSPLGLSTRDLAQRVLAATVALRCGPRIGAGFFVAPNQVVTNLHMSGQGGDPIQVRLRGGQTASAWVERSSERLDLALLRVGVTGPPLPLGDATSLGPGSPILVAGSPVGLDFTVTQGILSHAERTVLGVAYLQFDASVNPGNSGGPLVDDAGRAIGIVAMKVQGASGIGLALPVNYLVAGAEAWLPSPASRDAAARWQAVLGRTDEENGRAIADASDFLRRPGLAGVAEGRDRRLMALLVLRSHYSPSSELLRFSVRRRGDTLCRFDETATRWVPGRRRRAWRSGRGTSPRHSSWRATASSSCRAAAN